MKTRIHLATLIVASAILTFSSCQKEDDIISSSLSTTKTPDFSERGINPDDAVTTNFQERNLNERNLYTESNATAQNEILCYKQHGNGSLTLEATIAINLM